MYIKNLYYVVIRGFYIDSKVVDMSQQAPIL